MSLLYRRYLDPGYSIVFSSHRNSVLLIKITFFLAELIDSFYVQLLVYCDTALFSVRCVCTWNAIAVNANDLNTKVASTFAQITFPITK